MAERCGARVVFEKRKGYGSACGKAISIVRNPDILLFLNADGAEKLSEAPLLVNEVIQGADMVVGSRQLGRCEKGSLYFHQKLGNRFCIALINKIWGTQFTDLGPFRAVDYKKFMNLNLVDKDFGWIVKMQLSAIENGMVIKEIATTTKPSYSHSKISGSFSASLKSGFTMISTILYFAVLKYRKILSQ